jgi:DNA-binding phage protein
MIGDGELCLFAHALKRTDAYLVGLIDKGAITAAYTLGLIDRVVSLETVARKAGINREWEWKYSDKRLSTVRGKLQMGMLP